MKVNINKLTSEQREELEKNITEAVLRGAKPADVATCNGVKYQRCREMLHRHCKRVNKEAYERLDIDAANKDSHSPYLEILRLNKHEFMHIEQTDRTPEQLKQEIQEKKRLVNNANVTLRAERSELFQLEAELKVLK